MSKLSKKTIINKLKETNHRITQARIELIEILLKYDHLSVKDLSNKLVSPNITSLYNNLWLFEKIGVVGSVKHGNKKVYEIIHDGHIHDRNFYGHLIDAKGKIKDIDVSKEIKILKKKFKNKNIKSIIIEIKE